MATWPKCTRRRYVVVDRARSDDRAPCTHLYTRRSKRPKNLLIVNNNNKEIDRGWRARKQVAEQRTRDCAFVTQTRTYGRQSMYQYRQFFANIKTEIIYLESITFESLANFRSEKMDVVISKVFLHVITAASSRTAAYGGTQPCQTGCKMYCANVKAVIAFPVGTSTNNAT